MSFASICGCGRIPASTQIAVSIPAALDYYERSGQNWERSAMIKARPCAGDIAGGEAFLKNLSPFVWRKNLDYAALADVHAMKQQIHAYRGHGDIAIEGHNIKLGRGGIREIEFFVQTQQLIAGGRHPELRGRETIAMLEELARGGWIKEETRAELDAAYHFLRGVEHRLADGGRRADPYAAGRARGAGAIFALSRLPQPRCVRRRAARASAARAAPLRGAVRNAHCQYRRGRANSIVSGDGDLAANVQYFAERGFARAAEAAGLVQTWFSGSYRSLKSEVAREALADILPQFIDQAVRSENPDAALLALDRFLAALHGGASLFLQLRQNRDLVSLLATILSVAPRLADILAQQPAVMDSLLEPAFFGALPDSDQLEKALARTLGQAETFEDLLDRARMFGREHHVSDRGAHHFRHGVGDAGRRGFARACRCADPRHAQGGRRIVSPPITAGCAAGSRRAGARQAWRPRDDRGLRSRSDRDLRLRRNAPESDGKRPLPGSQYFARLTQRLINSLTVRTNYGQLYHVDMRLRPSGNSGPLATALSGLRLYQREEAWTWEHMALTRARVVVGVAGLYRADRKNDPRRAVPAARCRSTSPAISSKCASAVATERGDADRWHIKDAAGGLLDVEFVAQYLQLVSRRQIIRTFSTPTRCVRWKRRRARLCWRPTMPNCLLARRGFITISRKSCGSASADRFRSGESAARVAAVAGARGRPSRFPDARTASDRYAEARAGVLRAHSWRLVCRI